MKKKRKLQLTQIDWLKYCVPGKKVIITTKVGNFHEEKQKHEKNEKNDSNEKIKNPLQIQ